MDFIKRIKNIEKPKFSFAKGTGFARSFAETVNACSMYRPGFGVGAPDHLPDSSKIWAAFKYIENNNGIFLFNINGVNLNAARKGFKDYEEADERRMITEWELFTIIGNRDYLKRTIFHNEKVEFKQTYNFKILKWR